MADIPGLIEGAHAGAGLGHDFLRHIERTRIIVHMLEIMPMGGSDPVENYDKIRRELSLHSELLTAKEEVIVLNKTDLDADGEMAKEIAGKLQKRDEKQRSFSSVLTISAVTGAGLDELNELLWKMVKGHKE